MGKKQNIHQEDSIAEFKDKTEFWAQQTVIKWFSKSIKFSAKISWSNKKLVVTVFLTFQLIKHMGNLMILLMFWTLLKPFIPLCCSSE